MALQPQEATVALLIDCDNVQPDIVEFALQRAAQAGRVTVRRAYGVPSTLSKNWEQVLVRHSFTPCLQYPCASKRNTTDIALALDALELLLEKRVQSFFLVTSDSDFAYLCRKLRERGAPVYIAGEAKSLEALRSSCDQFFEWAPKTQAVAKAPVAVKPKVATVVTVAKVLPPAAKKKATKKKATKAPIPKQSPDFVAKAVASLVSSAPNGQVTSEMLWSRLRQDRPTFRPNTYGHATLLTMLKTYSGLKIQGSGGSNWTVSLAATNAPKPKAEKV